MIFNAGLLIYYYIIFEGLLNVVLVLLLQLSSSFLWGFSVNVDKGSECHGVEGPVLIAEVKQRDDGHLQSSFCAMLAEGFLRVLCYREERKLAAASHARPPDPPGPRTGGGGAGPNRQEPDSAQRQALTAAPDGPAGLLIPGCEAVLALDTDYSVCLDNCSLLEQYPDVQVATIPQHALYTPTSEYSGRQPEWAAHPGPRGEPVSIPDQGYLAMGPSASSSLNPPGSGLEPMSNSVLNGLLEKQLEEVYMQHLTDNLARCNSHLGNSLLHGLVPPPQPGGWDSLEASLEAGSGGHRGKKTSYLSTQNLVPCSSNFSSPVLRISEAENTRRY
ncbi:hypothetical protein EYF80_050801 [Liparis tanakae]|uniref:Uncharacterized protein n=1 Tax=Liparis tanakae TaxID=230148 RepID=A0A4Z2FCR4_9TELE|nr:hypothetical protein EYF80_050801 [Liparis tanakae]